MDHDGGYHLFFSHPRMVADLLAGFVDQPWVADLDLSTLERVNARLHAETLERRDGDVIWRLRRRDGGEAYLYLAIEFQSAVDRWMALRVAVYVLLLYLHLVREKKLAVDGLLPPVYPIVLYNGEEAWSAKSDLRDLIAPGPDGRPWPWRPRLCYHLVQEQDDPPGRRDAVGGENLVAVLFAMEQCRTAAELRGLVDRAVVLLAGAENAPLRRAFAAVLKAVLAPARGIDPGPGDLSELSEVREMLAKRVQEWVQDWERRSREHGRAEGEALALIRLLQKRFGPLPGDLRDRIMAADSAMVEAWLDRAIDAPSLDAVFAPRPAC